MEETASKVLHRGEDHDRRVRSAILHEQVAIPAGMSSPSLRSPSTLMLQHVQHIALLQRL